MALTSDKKSSPSILDLINKTLELPTIPHVLVKLNEVMADPESSADDVAQVISLDPAVSTNILRIVNSAYYGLQVRVSSVNLAVSIMGFNMTKKVALKAAIFSVFAKDKDKKFAHFDPKDFWQHSIYSGVLARVLGQASSNFAGVHPEDLYICGLLHDIGKIILLENACDRFESMIEKAVASGRPCEEIEQEDLGFTHADVGSVLAIKWFLPEDLTIAIRYHHAPDRDPFHKTLSSLISLAEQLAVREGKPPYANAPIKEIDPALIDEVGLSEEDLEELVSKANEEFLGSGTPW
jgi:HD-like signal output (HDOD) protein